MHLGALIIFYFAYWLFLKNNLFELKLYIATYSYVCKSFLPDKIYTVFSVFFCNKNDRKRKKNIQGTFIDCCFG